MDQITGVDGLQREWPPTRDEGLRRMRAFAPRMGGHYKSKRNHDLGPDRRDNVSMLSPWLRRRLVTEAEVVGTALATHSAASCEKFVQEVVWRGYFKGWLERRPSVWTAYRTGLARDRARLSEERGLAKAVAKAEEGDTGLDCFDAWARELVETGYLHNHARMWFASLWIFTLGLPWRLGADFFLRHLLDGDPASNTLGWRWVAGLHTRGKNYAAQAWNISKFTGGRFQPAPAEIEEAAAPLEEDAPLPQAAPVPPADRPGEGPQALLITEEDCQPETLGLDLRAMRGAAALAATGQRSDAAVSARVAEFDRGALEDAAIRARAAGASEAELLSEIAPDDLARWAARTGAREIVTAWVPTGPTRDLLERARPALAAEGARIVMVRRDWDEAIWPHADAGFFKVKKKIPTLLRRLA